MQFLLTLGGEGMKRKKLRLYQVKCRGKGVLVSQQNSHFYALIGLSFVPCFVIGSMSIQYTLDKRVFNVIQSVLNVHSMLNKIPVI